MAICGSVAVALVLTNFKYSTCAFETAGRSPADAIPGLTSWLRNPKQHESLFVERFGHFRTLRRER
jgi:hypothetical protein